MQPKILLLDEPLGALDALTRGTLQDEIARIWQQERKTVVLITNDIDEGILLADRIIPLSAAPQATLGPNFAVGFDRPRERKMVHHNVAFKKLRNQVMGYLLGPGAPKKKAKKAAATVSLVVEKQFGSVSHHVIAAPLASDNAITAVG